jgi:hypothetical protein
MRIIEGCSRLISEDSGEVRVKIRGGSLQGRERLQVEM